MKRENNLKKSNLIFLISFKVKLADGHKKTFTDGVTKFWPCDEIRRIDGSGSTEVVYADVLSLPVSSM